MSLYSDIAMNSLSDSSSKFIIICVRPCRRIRDDCDHILQSRSRSSRVDGQFFCSLSDHIPRAANQMTVVQHHSEADTRIAGSWFRGTETTVDQKVAGERRPRKRWCA